MFFFGPKKADGFYDRSPWGSFWFEPIGRRTAAGVRVDSDSAMKLTTVYSCVRLLAETFCIAPLEVKRVSGQNKTLLKNHPLYRVFSGKPNDWQSSYEFREFIMVCLLLRGNAFCFIDTNSRGEVVALRPVHPDRVKVELLDNGDYRYRIKQEDGTYTPYPRAKMWHIKGMSNDGIMGLNPIEQQREALGVGISAQDFAARYYANDATPSGGWVEVQGKIGANAEDRKAFRENLQVGQAGMNRGKLMILDNGAKYHPISVTPDDSQFLESRQFQVAEVARIYRVPPHMVGVLEKASYNSLEQMSLEFLIYTLMPWFDRWQSSIVNSFYIDDDIEVSFNTHMLARGDISARQQLYHEAVLDGWMSRNEARTAEGLNPKPGLDEMLIPMNMTTVSAQQEEFKQLKMQRTNPRPNPAPNTPPDDDEDDKNARYSSMAAAAIDRVVGKELALLNAKLPLIDGTDKIYGDEGFRRFIGQCLGISNDEVAHYCHAQREFVCGLLPNTEIGHIIAATENNARKRLETLLCVAES